MTIYAPGRCLPQDFLRHRGTLADLEEIGAIKAKRHSEFPNLVQLKYNQIASPMGHALVRQCRGIILDEADDWRVVARPFDKFFNHGEPHAATIDWSTARVQEKVDGSLCILYWYRDAWRVATSGTPDASGDVNGQALRFRDLFWDTFRAACDGYVRPWGLALGVTYLFELTSKHNRVVVKHDEPRLTLIGARDTETGEELDPNEAGLPIAPVRSFPLQSMADVEASFESMSPLEQEGYVIVDAAFNRIKVKHPGYVAIHHIKDGFGPRAILEAVRRGETPEILASFPEWQPEFEGIERAYSTLAAELDEDYARLASIETQKAFALEALKTRCSAALFQRRAGRIADVREHLATMPIKALMDTLGMRETEAASVGG